MLYTRLMPYKDPVKQKAAQRKSYEKNLETNLSKAESQRARVRGQIYTLKETTPCVDCNSFFPYYMVEYDHLDPKIKVASVSRLVRSSTLEKILKEISKCELVCSNCHKKRTWLRSKLVEMKKQVDKQLGVKMPRNSAKRKEKQIEHAEFVWTREQIQAAEAQRRLDAATATILRHKDELTEDQYAEVEAETARAQETVKDFLMKAKAKYEKKIAELSKISLK